MKHTKVQGNYKKKFHKNVIHARSLKEGRIIVRNLPFKATEDAIKKFFGTCGPIREVNLLRRPDGNPVGCAFIQFNDIKAANQAIDGCSGNQFMGRDITAALALEQERYITSRPDLGLKAKDYGNKDHAEYGNEEYSQEGNEEYAEEGNDEYSQEGNEEYAEEGNDEYAEEGKYEDTEESKPDVEGDQEDWEETKPDVEGDDNLQGEGSPLDSSNVPTASRPKRKRAERKVKTKKGRVVVRNVSFKATEDELKKHFGAYGTLVDVNLLRKPNGRMVGCAFLQYQNLKEAAVAIKLASGLNFLGRPVVLDWAVPKNEYDTKTNPNDEHKIKEEPLDEDEIKIEDDDEDETGSIKSESDSDVVSEGDANKEDDNEDYEDYEDVEEEPEAKPAEKYCSNDVAEGRTVFVKNIPFSADNKEFKACMEQFGEVEYGVICYDPYTEHSKGSGFAKFKDAASTQKCLEAGTELTLHGQVLDCHKALDRESIKNKGKKTADKKTSKDGRNLYLVKEGVVLAGSKSAENVSVTDMAKRLKVEQLKTQMLRNLNMFVSADRLIVHNVPPTYDDRRLRELFTDHSGPGAVVTEARIMRDMRDVDEHGVGRSKEMAFVRFTRQEDALTALRSVNNNPNVFTVSKRPIVTFAIENRQIHKVRQLREQKSRDKNPLYRKPDGAANTNTAVDKNKSAVDKKKSLVDKKKSAKRERRLAKRRELAATGVVRPANPSVPQSGQPPKKKQKKEAVTSEGRLPGNYAGVAAEPGNVRMRTKHNLKAQAALHTQTVRKDLQKKRSSNRVRIQQQTHREHIKQPKQKRGSSKNHKSTTEDESFSKLVNKYKTKITPAMMKAKWYDDS